MRRAGPVLLLLFAIGLFATSWLILAMYYSEPPVEAPPDRKTSADSPVDGTVLPPAHPRNESPNAPAKSEKDDPRPGPLRLFDDAARKQGNFWLEQQVGLPGSVRVGALLDLYLSVTPDTLAGTRLRLRNDRVSLERVKETAENPQDDRAEQLASADLLAVPAEWLSSSGVLGVLRKDGELTVWWNGRNVLTLPPDTALSGPSGARVLNRAVRLLDGQTLTPHDIEFQDDFMRSDGESAWQPWTGRWELTALAFPERSANPFSMRVAFDGRPADSDRLYAGRMKGRNYGLGVMLGQIEGTLQIERITGGSPAARAGLQEDDTIIAINGQSVRSRNNRMLMYLMNGGFTGQTVRLKIHRPGEPRLLDVPVKMGEFDWGKPLEGQTLQPVRPADEALVVTGQEIWSEYSVEVSIKALGAGGGGLAVAVTSPGDGLLLRWIGPSADGAPVQEGLELVHRVDGRDTVLARKDVRYRPYEFYRLRLDWTRERLRVSVDGVEVFDVKTPLLRRGKVGLYARRGDPVFFDDVRVTSRRDAEGAAARPIRKLNAIFAREEDMEGWANPALEWLRSERTPWAVHTARLPGEQVLVLSDPRFETLMIRPLLRDEALAPYQDGATVPEPDAELRIERGRVRLHGRCWAPAEMALPAAAIKRIALRASPAGAEADIDGHVLRTKGVEGGEVVALGDRLALSGLRNLGAPATARVTSSGTMEYTFDRAPVDWKVESGRWGLLNKWICDPRWSWFGGRTETIAALWNKHLLEGDQSIEVNVALMMRRDEPPYDRAGYERAGDFNLVLCGDGVNVSSGYSLICGGGENRWTRLYRNGVPVAESLLEEDRFPSDRVRQPDKTELHQRWFRLRLEKRGRSVSFYRDGHRAFVFEDPEPLNGGRAAFWTCENGVLLARAHLAAERIQPGPLESRRTALYDDGTVVNLFDNEVHSEVERVPLPAKIGAVLALPPERFVPLSCPSKGEPAGTAAGWCVTNGTGGGPLALQWKELNCNPDSLGVVRFAICIQPGAAVDLCLKDLTTGEYVRWRMTGPAEEGSTIPVIARVPGVAADGNWHAVQFDLGPSWRDYWKGRGYQPPQRRYRPLIACLDSNGYALAGFTGNQVGSRYTVSTMSFYRSSDADREAPKLAGAVWPYDPEGDGRSVTLCFDDPGGSGVRFDQLVLTVNGAAVPPSAWTFDEKAQRVRIDLRGQLGTGGLRDGQTVDVSIAELADRAGNRVLAGARSEWTCRHAVAAGRPAVAPEVQAVLLRGGNAPQTCWLNRQNTRPLENYDRVNIQEVDDAPPWATERESIRVTAVADGTNMGFWLTGPAYNLAHWPYLAIEYRMPSETPVNLHFEARSPNELDLPGHEGRMRTLVLGDTGEPSDSLTERRDQGRTYLVWKGDFVQDDTWRRVDVPLEALLSAEAGPGPWKVYALRCYDNGWLGNRKGMGYAIHAIHALPASRSDSIAFSWYSKDLTGTADFATALDENPDTVPTRQEMKLSESLENAVRRRLAAAGHPHIGAEPAAKDGWMYLHVRTKNGAGAWSPVVHYRFCVDNSPPRVARTEPANGAHFAGQTIRLFLDEAHSVDPERFQLRVGDRAYGLGDRALTYDAASKTLSFDATRMAGEPWAAGTRVPVALEDAADLLGNELVEPYRFSFVVDRALDRDGPTVEQVRFCAMNGRAGYQLPRPILAEVSMALDFEETLGHVHAVEDCRVDWVEDAREAAFGNKSVKVVCLEDDGNVEVMLHKNSWYVDRLPTLHFDYRADPGMKVDLQAMVMGKWYTFGFLGDGKDALKVLPDVAADGQWHHASVDLYDAIARGVPDLPIPIVSKVRFSAHGQAGCRRGATLWLDNLMLSPAEGQGGVFEWKASPDPSGSAGYAVLLDHAPGTVPPARCTTETTFEDVIATPGTWYLHVRAGDQAGNWGPVKHFRIDF